MPKSYIYYYPSITVLQGASLAASHALSQEQMNGHIQAYKKHYNEQDFSQLKNIYDGSVPTLEQHTQQLPILQECLQALQVD
jgi:hypothetical protein